MPAPEQNRIKQVQTCSEKKYHPDTPVELNIMHLWNIYLKFRSPVGKNKKNIYNAKLLLDIKRKLCTCIHIIIVISFCKIRKPLNVNSLEEILKS